MPVTKAPRKPSRASFIRKLVAAAPKVRPLDDRVILKVDEAAGVTSGGILLPESAKEKPQKGIIVAVGPGKLDPKTGQRDMGGVEIGDHVLFSRYGGVQVPDHTNYLIMRIDDVLCANEP